MRILITQSGENIFSEEEKREIIEKKFSRTTNKIYKRKLTIEKIINKKDKKTIGEKPIHKNYFVPPGILGLSKNPDEFYSKTTSSFYPKNIRMFTVPNKNTQYNKYRKIRINIQKVNFPKELQSKYDLYKIPKKSESNIVYEETPQKINKLNNPGYKFSLGEIIDNKALFKLKNEISTRERVKQRLSVVNEKNFRTNYAYTPKMKELNEILNYKKIKGDKLELIKYIHSHNHLSDLFLRNIVNSDNIDIEKYDKISQTLLFKKDLNKKLKLDLDRKLKTKQNLNKIKITNKLQKMNKEIKLEEQILGKYKKEYDKKLNYIDKHKEIQKGWKKIGINHLTGKTFAPSKPLNTSFSSNND